MPDSAELVHYAVADGVATLTLDSPHNRNALSRQLVSELFERLERAAGDDEAKVVLLTSSGRVFCSGADLSEAASGAAEDGPRAIVGLQRAIVAHPKPVVVALAGPVRAGGIGVVAAADIVVAAEEADFALTEVKLGLTPAAISLTVLPRLSSRAAAYACLTGEKFGAAAAAGYGLVTTVAAADALDDEVARVCASLVSGAPQGLRETKALLARPLLANIDAGADDMATLSARLFASDEAREAMLAFLSRK
ncbi:enoyl-CoA hydratase family protein [Nocardioides sp. CER19]|uniref:enoyl-CoA hydratase family protein n=1 Tax=Nocardioides sp. CER19 TaxID=3038538 RepID=UPI00244BAC43|nr:enoyl-CoA hydratase family protein [Nocardioides sp. CER19]MDH2412670.1 enoyl-CoA hydratase family protein [Nocardioides sp. CER19]